MFYVHFSDVIKPKPTLYRNKLCETHTPHWILNALYKYQKTQLKSLFLKNTTLKNEIQYMDE